MSEVDPIRKIVGNEQQVVPEILALDLDDTLYRTSEAFLVISALASRERLCDLDTIKAARHKEEGKGKTFDLDIFLIDQGVPVDEVNGLYDVFSSKQDPERFLYSDSLALIRAIRRRQTPAYILTRGTLRQQTAKLASAGLYNFPHVITDELVKSRSISPTRDSRGVHTIQTSVGKNGSRTFEAWGGTLIEDRPLGLRGLADIQWTGILLQRPGKLRRSQVGNPPEGSIRLQSLNPVTQRVIHGRLIGDMVREQFALRSIR